MPAQVALEMGKVERGTPCVLDEVPGPAASPSTTPTSRYHVG